MSFDQEQSHVLSLHDAVVEIKAILNNGLKAQLIEQKAELKSVKDDVQLIRDALTGHVAKEDVIYEIFKRVMNTGVTITGTASSPSRRAARMRPCPAITSSSSLTRIGMVQPYSTSDAASLATWSSECVRGFRAYGRSSWISS